MKPDQSTPNEPSAFVVWVGLKGIDAVMFVSPSFSKEISAGRPYGARARYCGRRL